MITGRPRVPAAGQPARPGWSCIAAGWEPAPLPRRGLQRPSIRNEELSRPRPSGPRCRSSWTCSRPSWRNWPANTSGRSGRILSSGCSSRTRVPPWGGSSALWKGFWSETVSVGAFYCELGIRMIEVCVAPKLRNGGPLTLEELRNTR